MDKKKGEQYDLEEWWLLAQLSAGVFPLPKGMLLCSALILSAEREDLSTLQRACLFIYLLLCLESLSLIALVL